MKSFFQFLESTAVQQATRMGLKSDGHGGWYDKNGEFVAKTERGQLKFYNKKQVPGQRDPASTEAEKNLSGVMPAGANQQQPDEVEQEEPAFQPNKKNKGTLTIAFGRFNPPHLGHLELMNTAANSVEDKKDAYMIVPSRSNDPKKNPLDPNTKVDIMKSMFPQHANNIMNDTKTRTIFDVLNGANNDGYANVRIVGGADRVKEFNKLATNYNGKLYDFDNVEVISSGERDPDAEGVEGMSASKLRAMAAAGDLEGFTQGVPGGDVKLAEQLMMEVRAGMGIVEQEQEEVAELWDIAPKLDAENLREAFFEDKVFPMGCIVEHLDTGIRGTVIRRGTNYVIFETPEHFKFNVWLTSIMEVKELHKSADDGSGNTWKVGTDTYRHAVQAMTPGQLVKKFSDFRKTGSTK